MTKNKSPQHLLPPHIAPLAEVWEMTRASLADSGIQNPDACLRCMKRTKPATFTYPSGPPLDVLPLIEHYWTSRRETSPVLHASFLQNEASSPIVSSTPAILRGQPPWRLGLAQRASTSDNINSRAAQPAVDNLETCTADRSEIEVPFPPRPTVTQIDSQYPRRLSLTKPGSVTRSVSGSSFQSAMTNSEEYAVIRNYMANGEGNNLFASTFSLHEGAPRLPTLAVADYHAEHLEAHVQNLKQESGEFIAADFSNYRYGALSLTLTISLEHDDGLFTPPSSPILAHHHEDGIYNATSLKKSMTGVASLSVFSSPTSNLSAKAERTLSTTEEGFAGAPPAAPIFDNINFASQDNSTQDEYVVEPINSTDTATSRIQRLTQDLAEQERILEQRLAERRAIEAEDDERLLYIVSFYTSGFGGGASWPLVC